MKIVKELWGKTPCGKEIYLYTLTNEKGAYVQLTSVGAGIVSVVVPDKNDGVTTKSKVYVEYIDISKENK